MIERIQELTARLEEVEDPRARAIADDLVTAVVQTYGEALERILDILPPDQREQLAADELVGGLLLVHDLHPVPVEERVVAALDSVRPYMESHGGNIELLGVSAGIARLRLQGSCSSCRASSETLELAVRQALESACPDLEGIDVEGVMPQPELAGFSGVALPMAGDAPAPRWHDLNGLGEVAPEHLGAAEVAGVPLVVANVEGTLLAYRDRCAACGCALGGGDVIGATLVCPACARGFVLTMAGRSVDGDELQLEPVPLLRDDAGVRVALVS